MVDSVTPVVSTKRAQVRAILEERIAAELRPGDALDSERNLVKQLGVSRVTVRNAIEDLVHDGVLERTQGKGTFVTGPRVNSRLHLMSFSREMRARGFEAATRVLDAAEVPAESVVANHLGVRPSTPVVRVERLRLADGTPMAYEVGYYPSQLLPGLLRHDLASLYDSFAAYYGLIPVRGEQTVRADWARKDMARMLEVAKKAPLLVQERITWAQRHNSADEPRRIEYSTSWYRADRYQIHSTLTPRGN